MGVRRRTFLGLAAATAVIPALWRPAFAQAYPTRPIRMVVGFAPAGGADIAARLIGQWLSERLGQQVVIENRPGAGSNLATDMALRAPADGYTLLLALSPNAINATLYEKLPFNFIRDAAPVASIYREPNVAVVHPSLPVKNISELIAYAKANPGKVDMASSGIGTTPHLAGELFKMMTGVNMLHVPYRSAAPALTDLLGGQVQFMLPTMSSSIAHIKSDKLRVLAVTSLTRADALPDVPALNESVPGYEASTWYGIVAPRNTPSEIVARLNKEVNAALADTAMKARVANLGGTVFAGSPADFAVDTEKWAKVVKFSGARAE
jgi:tripartite-type tricarboxylate transporter receptor subunit TctC